MVANGAIVLHRSVVGTGAIVAANAVVLYDVDVPAGRAGRRRAGHDQAGPGPHGGDHSRRRDVRRARPTASAASCAGSTDVLALVVTVPASEAELASDALWALGVAAIEERTPAGRRRRPRTTSSSCGRRSASDVAAITAAAEAFPARWRWRTVEIDPAVAESWRAHAVPSWVDRRPRRRPGLAGRRRRRRRAARRHRPRRGVRARRPPDDRADAAPAAPDVVAGRDGARRRLRQRRAVGRRGPPRRARTSRRSTSRRRPSRRRSPTPRATASAASVTASTRPLGDDRRAVRHRAGQPAGAGRRRAGRRSCGGSTAPAGALIVSGVLAGAHDHVLDALAPMQVVETVTREGWAALLVRH